MKNDFLKTVRELKETALDERMQKFPMPEMMRRAADAPPPVPFREALIGPATSIIGEVKRRSPSAGLIRDLDDPSVAAASMERGGAAAISILTDGFFFGGSIDDLSSVRQKTGLPLLRKDFIVHPYELFEARAFGADAVLLIVAMLGGDRTGAMIEKAAAAGLDCLVEVHDESELEEALSAGASLIGINNRNLRTLEVDTATAIRMAPCVPTGVTVVGESGYRTVSDISMAREAGIKAFLIGEALMRSPEPGDHIRSLLEA